MEIKLQKWGNSLGVRVPKSIVKSMNIKINDILDIKEEDSKIIISVPKKRKYHYMRNLKNIMEKI